MASIENLTMVSSVMFAAGMALLGTAVISNWEGMLHEYSLGGDTTTPTGLYVRLCHAFLAN